MGDDFDNDFSPITAVRVFFVDFGHVYDTDVLCIREIQLPFLKLPFQAVECSLANVAPPPSTSGRWSKPAREKFRQLTGQGVHLKAKVVGNLGGRLDVVDLMAWNGTCWDDIAEKLVEEKLATISVCDMSHVIESGKKITMIPG